jgi:hypothetical protein
MLPCFLPYDSNDKVWVEGVKRNKEGRLAEATGRVAQSNFNIYEQATGIPTEYDHTNASVAMKLKDPLRIKSVIRFREEIAKLLRKSYLFELDDTRLEMNIAMAHNLALYEKTTFAKLSRGQTNRYSANFISCTVMEDCIFGLDSSNSIVLFVGDQNYDFMTCAVTGLKTGLLQFLKKLTFGATILLIHPDVFLDECGDPVVGVQANNVLFIPNDPVKTRCRFCGASRPPKDCGSCRRAKYCDHKCQLNDWKLLKHKRICTMEMANRF